MKALIIVTAIILAASGGYVFGKTSGPAAVATDEIAALLPADMVAAIRDEDRRERLISIWDQISVKFDLVAGEQLKDQQLELPEGVPSPPFSGMQQAKAGVGWPDPALLTGGDVLEAAKDGWVVMNVWASWCAPCIAELPDVQNAATALAGDGITLITVNADVTGKDTSDIARQILVQRSATDLPFIMVEGKQNIDAFLEQIFDDPDDQVFPYTVIYAPGGTPFATFSGGAVSESAIWAGEQGLAFFHALATLSSAD